MMLQKTLTPFIAWLRFTKMSIHDRMKLEQMQQRSILSDAQAAARQAELQHAATHEQV